MSLSPTLKHHSASSVNSFLGYRHQWWLNRIQGVKTNVGAAAIRGTAVEHGINEWMQNPEMKIDEAIKIALEKFTQEGLHLGRDESFTFRQTIGSCVRAGIESFDKKFKDTPELQRKITVNLPGVSKPFIGNLDYFFENNLVVDNKVVGKTPSSLKQDYVLQGSIYRLATGLPVDFHFIIPLQKETKIVMLRLSDEDYQFGLRLATKAAQAIETIYDKLDELPFDLVKAFCFPNPDAIYGAEDLRIYGKEFGFEE